MSSAERVDTLLLEGIQEAQVGTMLTCARLYDLVDYEAYNCFDTGGIQLSDSGNQLTPAR